MQRQLLFFAICLPALIVLQLQANVDPVTVGLDGPKAGLLGQSVTFSASPTGGSSPYTYQWKIDSVDKGTDATQEYTVPTGDSNAKKVTVTCTVTDSQNQSKPADMEFWQVKFSLGVDANYDGQIDEEDDDVKMTQGGLIALNDDDDNRSGTPDLNESPVPNEDDLCPVAITLLPANIDDSSLTLSAPAGGNRIKVWTTPAKNGGHLSLPHQWNNGTQPQQVYVEGISPSANLRDIGLKLSFAKDATTLDDEIKLGVVKVEFESRSDTAYGFDDGSLTYPAPAPQDYTPQKYSWISVQNDNSQTKVNAKITPAVYANSVFFTVDDTAKATCSPSKATTNPQMLTLTGKGSALRVQTFLSANLGAASGPLADRLNVAVYDKAQYSVEFRKVSTATLVPDGTTWQQFRHGANMFLSRGVAELDGASSSGLTVEYDTNTNGLLDLYTSMPNLGVEWQAIYDAIQPQGNANYAQHVKPAISVHYPDGTVGTALGLIVNYGNYQVIVVTDACTSKAVTLCHEVLHGLGLKDVGPPGHNTRNLMYAYDNGMTYHLGWFPVELYNTQGTASGTTNQWEAISR